MSLEMMGLGGVLSFDIGNALGNMGSAARAFGNVSNHAATLSSTMNGIAHSAAGVSVALAPLEAAFGFTVKVSGDFQQALQNAIAVNSSVGSSIDEVKKKLLDMGAAGKFSAVETANAYADMAHVIPDAKDALTALVPVTNLAVATGESLADSQRAVVSSLEQYGLGVESAAHVTDVFATVTSRSQDKLNELAEGFKVVAPQARLSGETFEDTAAALGTLADAGIKGHEGGTALANMLRSLEKPSKNAIAIMEALGVTVRDKVTRNFRKTKDLVPELMESLKRFHGTADQARAALEVFGVRGVRSAEALSMLSKLKKGYQANADAIRDGAGAAKKMADTKMDSLIGSFRELKNDAESFAVELGEPLLKPLQGLADQVKGFVNMLREEWRALSPETKKFIGEVVILAGVLGGIFVGGTAAFALFAAIIGPLVPVFSFLAANAVGLQFALIALLSPLAEFLPVVGAIALAVGAAVAVWYLFSEQISAVAEGFKGTFSPVLEDLSDLWNFVVEEALDVWSSFSSAFSKDGKSDIQTWKEIGFVVGTVAKFFVERVIDMVKVVASITANVLKFGAVFAGATFHAVIGTIKQITLAFRELTTTGHVIEGLKRLGAAILDAVLLPVRAGVGAITQLADAIHYSSPLVDSLKQFSKEGFASFIPTSVKQEEEVDLTTTASQYATKPVVNVHTHVKIDGKEVALATGKVTSEIQERAGFKALPYQRRLAVVTGGIPLTTAR